MYHVSTRVKLANVSEKTTVDDEVVSHSNSPILILRGLARDKGASKEGALQHSATAIDPDVGTPNTS